MNSEVALSDIVLSLVATYFVHSTLLLGGCWLFFAATRIGNHELINRMWKAAFAAGFLTTLIQLAVCGPTRWNVIRPDARVAKSTNPSTSTPAATPVSPPQTNTTAPGWQVDVFVESPDTEDSNPLVDNAATIAPDISLPGPGIAEPKAAIAAAEHAVWSLVTEWIDRRRLSAAIVTWAVVASLFVILNTARSTRRLRVGSVITKGRARQIVDRLCRKVGAARPITLLVSDQYDQPIAFGFFRPTILVPDEIESQLTDDELSALLAHEVAHLVRADVWWLLVSRILFWSLPVQPLNSLARRRWQNASEHLCDQWAIEHGIKRLSLARCLNQVAQWRSQPVCQPVALPAGGSKSTVVGRVANLVSDNVMEKTWHPSAARRFNMLVILLAGIFALIAPAVRLSMAVEPPPPLEFSVQYSWEPGESSWKQLDREIESLEREMSRAALLLSQNENTELKQASQELSRKTAMLVQRYKRLQQNRKKESDR